MLFNRRSAPALSEESAKALINEVLEDSGMRPCGIPMDVLESYTEYRRDRHTLETNLLIIILVLFLLLPLFFIPPSFQVTELARARTGAPTFEIYVTGRLPVESIKVSSGGRSMPVTELSGSVFTVDCVENGTTDITVTLLNRQYAVWSTELSGIDTKAPRLVDRVLVNGALRIFVADDVSGVDFPAVYAYTMSGALIGPTSYDTDSGYVEFPLEDMTLFIPDNRGNELQFVLTVKK